MSSEQLGSDHSDQESQWGLKCRRAVIIDLGDRRDACRLPSSQRFTRSFLTAWPRPSMVSGYMGKTRPIMRTVVWFQ